MGRPCRRGTKVKQLLLLCPASKQGGRGRAGQSERVWSSAQRDQRRKKLHCCQGVGEDSISGKKALNCFHALPPTLPRAESVSDRQQQCCSRAPLQEEEAKGSKNIWAGRCRSGLAVVLQSSRDRSAPTLQALCSGRYVCWP